MTVNNVNALLNYAAGRTDAVGSMPDENTSESFGQFMSKVNGKVDAPQTGVSSNKPSLTQAAVPTGTVKQDAGIVRAEIRGADKADQAENTIQKETDGNAAKNTSTDAKTDVDTTDTVSEEVQKSGEKLVQEIAEEMDVTPEEVEEAMAVLGLTAVQLFDTDNLKQLLLAISGSEDELSLLTDETLYGNLQDLLGTVEETLMNLQEELGLSEEELDAFMEQMMSDQDTDAMAAEETPETNLEGMKDYTVSVQKDGETVRMKVTVNDESGSKSVQESVTGTSAKEVQEGQKAQNRDASANSGREGREGHSAGQTLLQTVETHLEAAEMPEAANVEYRSVQTEDIMNQIVEYMKINVKADTQSMEMQLHPASLGTLGVQIVAKDGVMTAHFTTQNEMVRAVVETQLIQLKNQFEEQGLKVDAVEVTVANHAYGQQFSQEEGNAEQEQTKARKGRRQINLDQIGEDEDLEEMEDSERIAVEMMQANGSTVDYSA